MADAVYLHIGVPKSGTTYVQEILWSNRDRLAELGYGLASESHLDHVRAMRDLSGRRTGARIPGAWDRLAQQVRSARGRVVISQENLCRATIEQAAAALESFGSVPTTAVITARDLARQITSYWQQQVKARYTGTLADQADEIISRRPTHDDFWGHQDVIAIADRWLATLPPERVVVVTVPVAGRPRELLWQRLSSACDLDPSGFVLDVEHPNESLGGTQVELLRRVNIALGERLPIAGGYALVRRLVANEILATQRDHLPLTLDSATHAWAETVAHEWVNGLRERGVRVVGDLGDLLPAPWEPAPDEAPTDEAALNRSAVAVITDLLTQWEHRGRMPRRGGTGGARRREHD